MYPHGSRRHKNLHEPIYEHDKSVYKVQKLTSKLNFFEY